jgi:hypothetical protein
MRRHEVGEGICGCLALILERAIRPEKVEAVGPNVPAKSNKDIYEEVLIDIAHLGTPK